MKGQNPFKEKLYNFTLPVSDSGWDRIAANLPPQRRRFPFLWLSLLGASLLIGATVVFLSVKNDQPETKENIESPKLEALTSNNNSLAKDDNSNSTLSSKIEIPENSTTEVTAGSSLTVNQQRILTYKTPFSNSSENQSTSSDAQLSVEAGVINSSSRNFRELNGISALAISPLKQKTLNSAISKIKPNPSCYKFSGSGGNGYSISADFFAGPGFSPRTFEDTGGESSLYAAGREATESSQYAWSAGARVNLNLKQGLAVRLGVMFEQIGDKFNYTDTSATQITTVIDSFFAADGTFLYTESNTVTILGTLIKKIHNRYNHLDIPLLLSYEVPMGRATIMLNAGPVLNLTSTQRGQILDPMLVPKHITSGARDELDAYKTNLGLSVYLGVGALFPLTDNISALIEPRYLYRIKPVTTDSYPLKEHRHFAGLNLGIRYHFD